jgi:UDP:flavonoid glycosyltransferase YjiC (YdhE family)
VAQEAVMPNADAVVCHGGYGSVLGALAYAVPLVLMPIFADDQWRNAERVAELGAGVVVGGDRGPERKMLDGPGLDAIGGLPDATEAVLTNPGYRVAAVAIAGEIEALAPVDESVELLERIAGGR